MSFAIGLEYISKECNMGTVLRSCYNFGASLVFTIGRTYKTQASDTPRSNQHIPVLNFRTLDQAWCHLPQNWMPIGVEITDESESIVNFVHPKSAIYLFGPEGGGLSKSVVKKCKYVLEIPSNRCLNLGICASIVMYDRISKSKGKFHETVH